MTTTTEAVLTILLNETATRFQKVQVQREGTILQNVYVDMYYTSGATAPYAYTTVSTMTTSILDIQAKARTSTVSESLQTGRSASNTATDALLSTQTVLEAVTSSGSPASSARSAITSAARSSTSSTSSTSSATPSSSGIALNKVADNNSMSGSIIGLSIGLPVGVFCLGVLIIVSFFYYKKSSTPPCEDEKVYQREGQSQGPHKRAGARSWLLSKVYGNQLPETHDLEKTQRIGDEGARIQYSIEKAVSNPFTHHVLTPQKAAFPPKCSVNTDDIDTFLYANPPRLCHIGSEMPSSTSSKPAGQNGAKSPKATNRGSRLLHNGKWTYESPLSRWFLTKSTYVQDQVMPALKSPTVKLKRLHILSRVNKQTAAKDLEYNESSPILSRPFSPLSVADGSSAPKPWPQGRNLDPMSHRDASLEYGSMLSPKADLTPTVLESANLSSWNPYSKTFVSEDARIKPHILDKHACAKPPKLADAPTRARRHGAHRKHVEQSTGQTSTHRTTGLRSSIHEARKSNAHELAEVYAVVRDYEPRLMDEIRLEQGEYVKTLARHTDGWCLVEKCSLNGQTHFHSDRMRQADINGPGYLNEHRGIVPGACLKRIT